MKFNYRRAQSIAEYALVIGLISASIIGLNIYFHRALQAKNHQAVIALTQQAGIKVQQYEPYYLDKGTNINYSRSLRGDESVAGRTRTIVEQDKTEVSGYDNKFSPQFGDYAEGINDD
jgi:hypothetical protein